MPFRAFVLKQGPFPRPPLRGFFGSTGPSVICRSHHWPSRVWCCLSMGTPADFPCCTSNLSHACCHPIPRRNRRMRLSSLLLRRRPSPWLRRVGFRSVVFGACAVFTMCCSPHGLLTPYRSLVLECFSPFVTSWSAPSASGWDEHRRSGVPPEDSTCLFKAHSTSPIPLSVSICQ